MQRKGSWLLGMLCKAFDLLVLVALFNHAQLILLDGLQHIKTMQSSSYLCLGNWAALSEGFSGHPAHIKPRIVVHFSAQALKPAVCRAVPLRLSFAYGLLWTSGNGLLLLDLCGA